MASQLLLVVENRHAEVWRLRPKLGRALRASPTGGAVSWAADPLAMDGADIPPPAPVTELAGVEPDGEPD